MSTARTDAEAEKDHLLEDEEEGSSSEMSGGRTAVGSPTNRLASIDIEGLNDVDVEKDNANKPDTPRKNVAKLVTWIVVNTLATIGIFSSVTFYQLARILLTPVVALINFMFYGQTIPRGAVYSLIPACVGVGIVSYFDTKASPGNAQVKTTSFIGVIFAFSGVLASSLYTVWVSSYQKSLKLNSMQLLYNQAPIGGVLLLYIIPWTDNFWSVNTAHFSRWMLILLSGVFASMINLSQFFIIGSAGPVSSTVVGHLKTCAIVSLGWITSGRSVGDKSIFGILLAIAGIIS
ncbi:MAG: hypothetical protein Q9167_000370 [Letrouitia subvulpina]